MHANSTKSCESSVGYLLKSVEPCATMLPNSDHILEFEEMVGKMPDFFKKKDEGYQNLCCFGCSTGNILPVKCHSNRRLY